jgi:hypothetical protein
MEHSPLFGVRTGVVSAYAIAAIDRHATLIAKVRSQGDLSRETPCAALQ